MKTLHVVLDTDGTFHAVCTTKEVARIYLACHGFTPTPRTDDTWQKVTNRTLLVRLIVEVELIEE